MRKIFGIFAIVALTSCDPAPSTTITFAGDLMLDRGVREAIDRVGVDAIFEPTKPLIDKADFGVANLECVLSDDSTEPIEKQFNFKGDVSYANALHNTGFTHLSVANNHSFDFGREGLNQTLAALRKEGIDPIGLFQAPQCDPSILVHDHDTVALFATTPLRIVGRDSDAPGSPCSCSMEELTNWVEAYRKRHPAHWIISTLHWGRELKSEPDEEQREQAHALINAGANLIVGHGAHVVQEVEEYMGGIIAYNLGNYVFDPPAEASQRGMILEVGLTSSGPVVKEHPILLEKSIPRLMN